MPTVEENQRAWGANYEWFNQGEEWSSDWGGSEAQWYGAIYPRIHSFLPTGTALEIAPGYGRWTNYLREYCQQLVGVDLAETCIQVCRQRFAVDTHLSFHVNDGNSLAMIPDGSIDFIFSFDSLVHAERDVIEGYLNESARILKPYGVGFIHHSNIGQYQQDFSLIEGIPGESRKSVIKRKFLGPTHWRAASMTATLFADYCDQANLQCVSQELVNWGATRLLIDCFSLFTPKNSAWARPNIVIENPGFMREARMIKRLSRVYTVKSFQSNNESA